MELSSEEREIVASFRKLSESKKKAVLASENSFQSWLKNVARWLWERIMEIAAHKTIRALFEYLTSSFFRR